jgi:hypothetical protein
MSNSTNHHYIPQYYIRGFASESDNLLYVYDKEYDKINPNNRKGPAGLFFEKDLNSIFIGQNEKFTLLEDELFKKIDDFLKHTIRGLRDFTDVTLFNDSDLHAKVDIIIIDFFWRNPSADYLFRRYYDNPKHRYDILESIFKNFMDFYSETSEDGGWEKVIRASMGHWTIKQYGDYINKHPFINKYYLRILDRSGFVIGDNPVLFKKFPSNLEDIFTSSYLFPTSKNRLYLKNIHPHSDFTRYSIWINALIIDQSKKYICSDDLSLLEDSVKKYKELKSYDTLQNVKTALFAS